MQKECVERVDKERKTEEERGEGQRAGKSSRVMGLSDCNKWP